jgi:hypothetical protein
MGNQPTLEQIVIAARSFCEKNALKFPAKTGRPPILSFSEILALLIFWQILKVKTFFAFYHGQLRKALEEFFPKLPEYSGVIKRLHLVLDVLVRFFRERTNLAKIFRGFAAWQQLKR